ncbi:hypothetical protein BaRGS_00019885, partial [Batillaria attramentaria]
FASDTWETNPHGLASQGKQQICRRDRVSLTVFILQGKLAMMAARCVWLGFTESFVCLILVNIVRVLGSSDGISVRDYRGIPSIQEVECWGGTLEAEVILFSLKMFTIPDKSVLAVARPTTNDCMTFSEFSSCAIDASDTRKSRLRVLAADLEEGESRTYGCN